MRVLRVSLFFFLAAALILIGLGPRKISAERGLPQASHQQSARRHASHQRKGPELQVKSIKPAVTPGAMGLVAVPIFTDDKQTPVTGGPSLTIPLFNASTTNTITISGVTIGSGTVGQYSVTTNCTTLAPGATCNVVVTFISPGVCGAVDGFIEVANNDPILDGAALEIEVEGWGSDGNFQFKNLTDPTLTAQQLANQLVGGGVQISNVKYTGAAVAAGTFHSTSNIIGFTDGIILSTGSIRSVAGSNCTSGIAGFNFTAGDPDLTAILGAGHTTNDAAVLEFDFIPKTSTLTFSYVFASDEYNEFVGSFNDVFAFFVNQINIALLPGVTPPTPVSINNVNMTKNPQFFRNNDVLFPNTLIDTEMDGLTTVLTATAQVNANQTNHMKLAIADADDNDVDSNVFIEAGSLSSSTLTFKPTSVDFGNQPVGTTSGMQPITVTNVGNIAVNITSIVASAGFGETDNCVGAVPASGTCTIQATFTPTTATAFNGTIVLNDDATDSPQSVPLSGTGTSEGPTLTSITVTPNPATVAVGGQIQFTATGHFSDNSTKDVTAQSMWTSSSTGVATIGATTGLAMGVAVSDGSITITAKDGTVTGTAQLTVTNVPIQITIPTPPGGSFGPINPGGTIPIGVVLTSNPGTTGTVTFSCTTSSPLITCVPVPSSVNLTPGGPTQVAIVVNTFCKGTTSTTNVVPGGFGGGLSLLMFSALIGGIAGTRRRNPRWVLSFAALVAIGIVGCNSLPRGPNGSTIAGDYSVTIGATINGQTVSSAPITFHVN